ncbi:hypothetical protein SCP_1000310 [Sparassis crispa]|uniref:Uncharacterized protein n=1 Tax=Sparassis crispa TaxID=139825 RepID=A0A401GXA3_9APHY|nr:hypothetical protein SCP_1000310 [Sparassis crispa]GBE86789.1 hypothetical protein SCP_1000310 [Sparassis crispa]
MDDRLSKQEAHNLIQMTGGTSFVCVPSETLVVSGSDDGSLMLWDVESGRELDTITEHTNSICALAVSPDGHTLLSAARDGLVLVWDVHAEGVTVRGRRDGHDGSVNALAIAPNGRTIAMGSADYTVSLWDSAAQGTTHVLRGHTAIITCVQFSAGGGRVGTAGADCLARV